MIMPKDQQRAAMNPAFLGPARSSQPPQIAAEDPRRTKKRVYIHPRVETFQSQLVTKSSAKNPTSGPHLIDSFTPSAFDKGSQNTEKPYAIPMHK